MTDHRDLLQRARAWRDADPDPAMRAELDALIAGGDVDELAERLNGDLEFGTAGIRGVVGAGSLRMNRAVVIRTTRGLADWILATGVDPQRGVVVGFDARLDSRAFADDTVGVLVAAGIPVRVFPEPVATPIVAYEARATGAASAVVITASHNPPEYNGYKVYAPNAAQIIPPTDVEIAAAIGAVGPANAVPRDPDPFGHELTTVLDTAEVFDRYWAEVAAIRPAVDGDRSLAIVHTPLHGVGGQPVLEALARAGYTEVRQVPQQVEPDGHFPTVAFPNPEEPGALDLAQDLAAEVGADLIVANDPDVDRLAVSSRADDGSWVALTGNQIGVLLADYLLRHTAVDAPLVLSSIVSSPMLADVAASHGAHYEPTLTGFKWIANAAMAREVEHGEAFVFGYEEALGYTVGPIVRDKDGISAAVVFADLAAALHAEGRTLDDALDALYRQHGLWVSGQVSLVRPGLEGLEEIADAMTRIDASTYPPELDGLRVVGATDYRTGEDERPAWLPNTSLVALQLEGGSRVLIRPSGTEPKLKIYVDLREDLAASDDVDAREAAARERCQRVGKALAGFVGLG